MEPHPLLKELQLHHSFPVEEFPRLLSLFEERTIPKNEVIFKAGDIVKHALFIIKGCMMQYYSNPKGIEKIIFFAEDGWWTGEMTSFLFNTPTNLNQLALEDCQVLSINKANWEYAIRNIPEYAFYHIKRRQKTVTMLKEIIGQAATDTPDEKYRRLLKENPGLFLRVPQYHIACYLGVTAETLSRIRKRNQKL